VDDIDKDFNIDFNKNLNILSSINNILNFDNSNTPLKNNHNKDRDIHQKDTINNNNKYIDQSIHINQNNNKDLKLNNNQNLLKPLDNNNAN